MKNNPIIGQDKLVKDVEKKYLTFLLILKEQLNLILF